MLHRAIAGVVIARLVLAPWAAADDGSIRPGPIAAAASQEAARAARQPTRGAMPGGLKWTGAGLLIGSMLPVSIAKLGDCISDEFSCRDKRAAAYAVGGVMAGTGALLLVIAHHKRPEVWPTVSVQDGRASITQRVTF